MHRRPDCLPILERLHELVPPDHCDRVFAPNLIWPDLAHLGPSLGPCGRCCFRSLRVYRPLLHSCRYFCNCWTLSGVYAVAFVASRGNYPLLHPSVPRHCFLLVYPPCIYRVINWLSSALWAVVPVRLLHHRPYRRCLRSRKRACRLNRRQWLLSGWWVGSEFLRRLLPTQAGHSSAQSLLTERERERL